MEIKNFKFVRRMGSSPTNWVYHATVDVTTGILLWRKTEEKMVCKKFGGDWFFVETGEFTPGWTVQNLARAFSAQTGLDVQ